MKSSRRFALIVLAALAAASACSKASPTGNGGMGSRDAGPVDPLPVEVETLTTGPIEATMRFSANLEAETQVRVLSRTAGHVVKLDVEEGDRVRKGAVLLRLESDAQRSALASVENELAKAERLLSNRERLHAKGVVSDQDLEAIQFEVKRLRIARDDAARSLRYTTVRAAVGGTVTQRMVRLGDFVNPNQHLFDIADFDSIVAKVFVPEKQFATLEKGLSARIFTPSTDELLRQGSVERVAPVVDPRSGTVKVTIAIPKSDTLRPGAFVDVELVTDQHDNAVLVPRRAVVYDNDELYVYRLVGDDRVERIRIEPALEDRDHVEPRSGLSAGDRVVTAGQVGLKHNALVTPTEPTTAQRAP